jgi:hypothetical protein
VRPERKRVCPVRTVFERSGGASVPGVPIHRVDFAASAPGDGLFASILVALTVGTVAGTSIPTPRFHSMAFSQADLDLANHQVMEGEEVIAQRCALIVRMRQDGEPTEEAEQDLKKLEQSLDQLKRHRDLVQSDLAYDRKLLGAKGGLGIGD